MARTEHLTKPENNEEFLSRSFPDFHLFLSEVRLTGENICVK
jgi:hypothetical protein